MNWIKCFDEMPEKHMNVLFTHKYRDYDKVILLGYFHTGVGTDYWGVPELDTWFIKPNEVSHWMPLPELPPD